MLSPPHTRNSGETFTKSGIVTTTGQGKARVPVALVHLSLLFTQVAYGGYGVLTKLALQQGADQIVFCVYRDIIALLVLFPVAYVVEKKKRPAMSIDFLFSFLILGATGILGNQLLIMFGLSYTGPITTSAFQPSVPVLTFALAVLTGMETLHLGSMSGFAKLIGIAICVVGAVIAALFRGPAIVADLHSSSGRELLQLQSRSMLQATQINVGSHVLGITTWQWGILCLIGNCSCMAAYLTFQAPVLARYPAPISVTALSYLFGASLMCVAGVIAVQDSSKWILTPFQIVAAVYGGLVASALNYSLQSWGNKRLGPSMVALYMPLQPLASAVLSRVVLGNAIYVGSLIGGLMIIGGLFLVTWGRGQHIIEVNHTLRESSGKEDFVV